jgi:hypothetical protein
VTLSPNAPVVMIPQVVAIDLSMALVKNCVSSSTSPLGKSLACVQVYSVSVQASSLHTIKLCGSTSEYREVAFVVN